MTALKERGYFKCATREILDDIFDIIIDLLVQGEEITIRGFGTFYTVVQKEKHVIDPNTKERILLPPIRMARFKPGQIMRDSVRYNKRIESTKTE